MKTIFNSSRRTTFLHCASLGEDSHMAPPYTKMGEASQRQIFTWPLSSNGWQDPSIWHLLVDHLELEPHHLTPSFMSYTRSSFWCKLMTRHLTQHRYTKHIDHGLVHKAILTSAYHTMRSHDPSWYITSLVCWSTCTKLWSTYNLLLSLALIPTYGDQAKHMDTPTKIA